MQFWTAVLAMQNLFDLVLYSTRDVLMNRLDMQQTQPFQSSYGKSHMHSHTSPSQIAVDT